ncbi:unnamed protein product [Heligmosomoides polygyrus]|uniref:Clathrin assembly protein n=1 Tax=Heligmosomoides polygyrus TaxID=6339 RepID=A0A183GNI4_HELPZ|nr:unnamed protein product [Heligmosomoides polygyrus]
MMDKMSSPGTTSPENPLMRVTTTPQATPTPPPSLEPGVPMQFQMPFFANPFMSPFMPQQGFPADVAAVPTAGGNPAMPAFFFSPAQYQEMMQQYFTQMMTANQYGVNLAFPMPLGTTLLIQGFLKILAAFLWICSDDFSAVALEVMALMHFQKGGSLSF